MAYLGYPFPISGLFLQVAFFSKTFLTNLPSYVVIAFSSILLSNRKFYDTLLMYYHTLNVDTPKNSLADDFNKWYFSLRPS